jgi:hypothetical protein
MRDCICAAFVALSISMVGADSASASCVDCPFEYQIRSADIIFVGTLHRLESAWTAKHTMIITRYQFSQVRYIKGASPRADLILVQEGGRVGNEEIMSSIDVEFREGRRYVVFAYIGMGYHVPQPCGWSPFGIWPDSGSATPVVHLGNGGPVLTLQMHHVVALRDHSWETDYPPGGKYPRVFNESTRTWDLPEYLVRPVRKSLFDVVRSADSEDEATSQGWNFTELERQRYLDRIKLVFLWPHQDLGTRVTEPDFIAWLERICLEQSSMPADSTQSR